MSDTPAAKPVLTNIRRGDLIWLWLHLIPRQKINWIIGTGFSLYFLFNIYYKGKLQFGDPLILWGIAVLIGAIGGVAVVLFCAAFSMIFSMMTASQKNGILGGKAFTITQDGLAEVTANGHTFQKWQSIEKTHKSSRAIYLRFGGCLVHIIPRRAFATHDEYDGFYAQITRHWRMGLQQT